MDDYKEGILNTDNYYKLFQREAIIKYLIQKMIGALVNEDRIA